MRSPPRRSVLSRFAVDERGKRTKDLRINEQIRISQVRLIAEDGAQLGIVPTTEALNKARDGGLDLVEVAPQSNPPVCRLMNYGKFKYAQKRQKSETPKKHHVSKLKELWLHPKTERHDVEVRLRQARKFLERGDKVLVTMIFRGRELAHIDLGRKMLDGFAAELADIGRIEQFPRLESKRMGMLLVHQKTEKQHEPTAPLPQPEGGQPVS